MGQPGPRGAHHDGVSCPARSRKTELRRRGRGKGALRGAPVTLRGRSTLSRVSRWCIGDATSVRRGALPQAGSLHGILEDRLQRPSEQPQRNRCGTGEKGQRAESLSSLPQALFSIFFRDKEPREREICLELAAGISRGLSGRTPTSSRWLPEDPVGCVLEVRLVPA